MSKIVFIVELVLPLSAVCQELSIVKDLRPEAMKFEDGGYKRADQGETLSTYYFFVEASGHPGEYLRIKANQDAAVFISGKLAASNLLEGIFSLDSLRLQFASSNLLVVIYQETREDLSVEIVSRSLSRPVPEEGTKPQTSFRDFVVVAILVLLVFFIVLMRLNPKLTSDYFSLDRIFSLRETDDAQIYSRITSSSNILFYVFCSLMAGFCLTIIFEFTATPHGELRSAHFWMSILEWIKMSFIILSLFFLKILLVYSLAGLFGIKGVGGVHFFYWIRVLLVIACLLTSVLFLYFVLRGQSITVYQTVLWIITFVLISMIVLVFLKLMRRTECSIFHLFSYICATEIIPFLITIKLLHQ